ncbi:MAG: DUF2970 domain-containing protein [Agarilytica sp.]
MSDEPNKEIERQEVRKISTLHLIATTLAAAIGVQKRENLEKDFQSSSPYPFIAAGIIFTFLFMTTIILVVKAVLSE